MYEKHGNIFTPALSKILNIKIFESAKKFGHEIVFPKDLIICILSETDCLSAAVIKKMKINVPAVKKEIAGIKESDQSNAVSKNKLHSSTNNIITLSHKMSDKMEYKYGVGTEHVMLAFLDYKGKSSHINCIKNILYKFGLNKEDFLRSIFLALSDGNLVENESKKEETSDGSTQKSQSQGAKKMADSKPQKDPFARYLESFNERVKRDDYKFIGREKELERAIQILCRKTKSNLIVLGEPGVGKTSFVEGIADRINKNLVPKQLLNTEIQYVNIGNVVAGTKYRGQFEERLKGIFDYVRDNPNGNRTILFFDEIHSIVGAGNAEGALDASTLLKPEISSGTMQCIGATTFEDYKKYIQKDEALTRRFSNLHLDETNCDETKSILNGIKSNYESFYDMNISEENISTIVKYSNQYIKNRYFPDKAIDILDESCSKYIIQNQEHSGHTLDNNLVLGVISQMAGVPISAMTSTEIGKLKNIKNVLNSKVVNQGNAVEAVTGAIRRSRKGFKDPDKPMGVFLFLGPTGTGKTLLAKELSMVNFGTDKIIRLDMSEYMDKISVSKITGAAPGYVGYEEESPFTDAIRKRPYSVILLDEIEKAHRDVTNVFLQIFDEGRLTTNKGKTVDFRNTIIIMTSNVGTASFERKKPALGFNAEVSKSQNEMDDFLSKEMTNYFAPEFINRIDQVVVFNKFNQEQVKQIFEIEWNKTYLRLEENGYQVNLSDDAKTYLCKKGHDEKYGARPMKRALAKYIETALADKIFEEDLGDAGIVYVEWDADKDALLFKI